jgi:hypothetical protein
MLTQVHTLSHAGEKPFPCTVQGCVFRTSEVSGLHVPARVQQLPTAHLPPPTSHLPPPPPPRRAGEAFTFHLPPATCHLPPPPPPRRAGEAFTFHLLLPAEYPTLCLSSTVNLLPPVPFSSVLPCPFLCLASCSLTCTCQLLLVRVAERLFPHSITAASPPSSTNVEMAVLVVLFALQARYLARHARTHTATVKQGYQCTWYVSIFRACLVLVADESLVQPKVVQQETSQLGTRAEVPWLYAAC